MTGQLVAASCTEITEKLLIFKYHNYHLLRLKKSAVKSEVILKEKELSRSLENDVKTSPGAAKSKLFTGNLLDDWLA